MTWMEEDQKRKMADAAERGARKRAQNKKVIRIVAIAAFLAIVVLAVGIITHDNGARLPLDLGDPEGTIAAWERAGFVKSIDNTRGLVVVDDVLWNDVSHDEKTTIAVFLSSYCAEKRGEQRAVISIRGYTSQTLLGGIDSAGIRID